VTRADDLTCDACSATVPRADAIRTETYGDLDADRWQTLCCPTCGKRLRTVLVRD
jgi:ribosomal protein S26